MGQGKQLKELESVIPNGMRFENFWVYPVSRWDRNCRCFLDSGLDGDCEAWNRVPCTLVGQDHYGGEIVVTESDPISEEGGIYVLGCEGPRNVPGWPETLLRLGRTATEWRDRLFYFGSEFGLNPGGIEEEMYMQMSEIGDMDRFGRISTETVEAHLAAIDVPEDVKQAADAYRRAMRALNPGIDW